uniref:Uncharacterized protein n=1 Tax=Schistocephalus solidus TaxID=70667 RepID=A0A0X3PQU2_SCHSO
MGRASVNLKVKKKINVLVSVSNGTRMYLSIPQFCESHFLSELGVVISASNKGGHPRHSYKGTCQFHIPTQIDFDTQENFRVLLKWHCTDLGKNLEFKDARKTSTTPAH